ncbi:MAG TPA: hypothetical protein VFQ53_01510 [Kofleriaceae bacterium]|nr:hypothetical protein [Kofleriaceae bacterium]
MSRALALVVAVSGVLLAGCSYGARFDDCDVRCTSADDCPAGFSCGTERRCRPEGASVSCAAVLADAGDGGGGGDGTAGTCSGSATACAMLGASATCMAQAGCTFTATACKLTVDCTVITTNQQCMATPGCGTDFTTSTCKPLANYCQGTTKAACEMNTNCALTGGCAGTPTACDALASEVACTSQSGCSWN